MTTNEATAALISAGARHEKREDRSGATRSGWWLDGVFLGKDARAAWAAINGN